MGSSCVRGAREGRESGVQRCESCLRFTSWGSTARQKLAIPGGGVFGSAGVSTRPAGYTGDGSRSDSGIPPAALTHAVYGGGRQAEAAAARAATTEAGEVTEEGAAAAAEVQRRTSCESLR